MSGSRFKRLEANVVRKRERQLCQAILTLVMAWKLYHGVADFTNERYQMAFQYLLETAAFLVLYYILLVVSERPRGK